MNFAEDKLDKILAQLTIVEQSVVTTHVLEKKRLDRISELLAELLRRVPVVGNVGYIPEEENK